MADLNNQDAQNQPNHLVVSVGNTSFKTIGYALIVGCVVGIFIGGALIHFFDKTVEHHYTEKTIETKIPIPHVEEKVVATRTTTGEYVPKATQTVMQQVADQKTGQVTTQPVQVKEKTDIEVNSQQTNVNVKVNGVDHAYSLLPGETQKFENGKFVLTQTSSIGLSLTHDFEDIAKKYAEHEKRKNTIGVGAGTNGIAINYHRDLGNVVGAWTYIDSNTKAGGLDFKF